MPLEGAADGPFDSLFGVDEAGAELEEELAEEDGDEDEDEDELVAPSEDPPSVLPPPFGVDE